MKNFLVGSLFVVTFFSLSAHAGSGDKNSAWLFWCRIAETGQKLSVRIPVVQENGNETVFSLSEEVDGIDKLVYQAQAHSVEFSLQKSSSGEQWFDKVQIDLGRSGKVKISIPYANGPSSIVSTMREFFYAQGVQSEYCSTFYTTGPKPVVSTGN